MVLSRAGSSITIDAPLYGYSVEIELAFTVARFIGRFSSVDYGSSYDHRMLVASTHWLNESTATALYAFLRENRGEDVSLILGDDPTGFFPFGPDLGDKGTFSVYVDDCKGEGITDNPFRHFAPELRLKLRSAPAYTIPGPTDEGNLEFCGVKFRWPQEGVSPELERSLTQGYTRTGVPFSVDLGSGGDVVTTELKLESGAANISYILSVLTAEGRTGDLPLNGAEHHWLCGPENGSSGSYLTRLIDNKLVITHDRCNSFSMPVKLWMREKL